MANVSLTQNEITALKTCLNYNDRAGQLSDNYSNGGQAEFKAALGWNDKQVAALIGSLEEKGMGYGDHNDGNGHVFWLSPLAVNTLFDIMDAEKVERPTYAHAKGARAAARKVLGSEAGEGKEFTLTVGDDGRWTWTKIEAVAAVVEVAPVVEEPKPSAAASAFGMFAQQQLGASNNATTSTTKTAKAPAEKKVKTPPELANGVRKPSVGTVCRAVWDKLTELQAKNGGTPPDSKQVKALALEMSWNPNNASIEFYQWRKFHGITGRAPKAA